MKVLRFKGEVTKCIDKFYPDRKNRILVIGDLTVLYKGVKEKLHSTFLLSVSGAEMPGSDVVTQLIREEIAESNKPTSVGHIDRFGGSLRFSTRKKDEDDTNTLWIFLPEIAPDDQLLARGKALLATMDGIDLDIDPVPVLPPIKQTENGLVLSLKEHGVMVTFNTPITYDTLAYFTSHIEAFLEGEFVYEGIDVVLDEDVVINTFTGYPLLEIAGLLRNRLENSKLNEYIDGIVPADH